MSRSFRGAASARDVVIAGLGLVTPAGVGVEDTWTGISNGRSSIGPLTYFDPGGLDVGVAGEIGPRMVADPTRVGITPRTWRERLALRALDEAMVMAEVHRRDNQGVRIGVFTGCEKEATDDLHLFRRYEQDDDIGAVVTEHLHDLDDRHADRIARLAARALGPAAVTLNYSMACAASAAAVARATQWIRRGRIDRAVVIGVDTPIKSRNAHGFHLLGALSPGHGEPHRASRPFDLKRDGFVLAEGAGAMILESGALSRARQGPDLGRIVGVGITNNRDHITKTPKSGFHAARAIRLSLEDAGLAPANIGYVNVHATSTDVGDIGEANAILSVFEPPPPVSATKSMTGHLVAAAGIVELGLTLLALQRQFLPPTINLDDQDPECPLDCVANVGRDHAMSFAVSNSFGFGGSNVSIVLGARP